MEQPLSDKTLSRFRKRCYDYDTAYGIDLYHDCIKDLGHKIAKLVICLQKQDHSEMLTDLEHYCDSNDFNKVFYYCNGNDTEARLKEILESTWQSKD